MTVKLSLLDRINALGFDEIVDVALATDTYKTIGTCTIFTTTPGEYWGEIQVDRELNENLYFYYTFTNFNGVPWFAGIQLNKEPRKNSSTTQLKSMIF